MVHFEHLRFLALLITADASCGGVRVWDALARDWKEVTVSIMFSAGATWPTIRVADGCGEVKPYCTAVMFMRGTIGIGPPDQAPPQPQTVQELYYDESDGADDRRLCSRALLVSHSSVSVSVGRQAAH